MVQIAPMTVDEFEAFLKTDIPRYATEHVRAGNWGKDFALERSEAEFKGLLPQGAETPDHHLCKILDEVTGQRVGEVWYAIQRDHGVVQVFVFWIGIEEPYRRHGFATQTFHLLEVTARKEGASRVALSVFGHNQAAHSLYARLGYVPIGISMAKSVAP